MNDNNSCKIKVEKYGEMALVYLCVIYDFKNPANVSQFAYIRII